MGKFQRKNGLSVKAKNQQSKSSGTRKPQTSGRIQKHQPKSKPRPEHEQHSRPVMPFSSADDVLLVGEGDFSFAQSLFKHHRCNFKSLCATCFDSHAELVEKYPQAEKTIDSILSPPDAQSEDVEDEVPPVDQAQDEELPLSDDESSIFSSSTMQGDGEGVKLAGQPLQASCKVLYSIDATALQKYKPVKSRKWDRIVFNFPHVGGKSTDVNRQVRYNQALVHSFLQSSIALLSQPTGTILLTMFEGPPYELWNVRDLARSAGLRVVRSFAFHAELYPGYQHVRTIGNIRLKSGTGESGGTADSKEADVDEEISGQSAAQTSQRAGKWRGEERKARTYEFGLMPQRARKGPNKKRKRSTGADGGSSDEAN